MMGGCIVRCAAFAATSDRELAPPSPEIFAVDDRDRRRRRIELIK